MQEREGLEYRRYRQADDEGGTAWKHVAVAVGQAAVWAHQRGWFRPDDKFKRLVGEEHEGVTPYGLGFVTEHGIPYFFVGVQYDKRQNACRPHTELFAPVPIKGGLLQVQVKADIVDSQTPSTYPATVILGLSKRPSLASDKLYNSIILQYVQHNTRLAPERSLHLLGPDGKWKGYSVQQHSQANDNGKSIGAVVQSGGSVGFRIDVFRESSQITGLSLAIAVALGGYTDRLVDAAGQFEPEGVYRVVDALMKNQLHLSTHNSFHASNRIAELLLQ